MLNTIIGKRMQSKPVYARHLSIYISLRHVPEAHLNKQNKNAVDQITSLLLIHCYDEQEMAWEPASIVCENKNGDLFYSAGPHGKQR